MSQQATGQAETLPTVSKKEYRRALHGLQIELVKLQRHFIEYGDKILVVLEGRDASGKDGVIKRIIRHLSPRETRVVALGKPSDRDRTSWYFQRFVPFLPAAQEFVLFNRSWYNRAGVERVMGFCEEEEYEEFLQTVNDFEQMLVRSEIKLFKYYLDISKDVQRIRLAERRADPLKRWKVSPIDDRALELWPEYSEARDAMLERTHASFAPWTVVRSDDKRMARLNLIRDLLSKLDYGEKSEEDLRADPEVVFSYRRGLAEHGALAP